MNTIATLLLVLMLTGAPVASVLCVTECQQGPVTSGHCHADMATNAGPMVSANGNCDEPSIGDRPFVVEPRAVAGAVVLTSTSLLTTPSLVRTAAPTVPFRAADGLLKPPLVLRI